jgi:hypothetical protein
MPAGPCRRRDPAARPRDRPPGASPPVRPDLQRRQDLPGAAGRRGAVAGPAARPGPAGAGAAAGHRLRRPAQRPHHLAPPAAADQRVGGQLLRPARSGGPLAQGVSTTRARPAGPKGGARPLQAPGTYWEYNDVRINQLSLALLHLFGRPLPEVFRDAVLQPLGAQDASAWEPYDDAWLEVDGRRVQSVPGGTHWGGGVSISARDQARLAQLVLQGGPLRWRPGRCRFGAPLHRCGPSPRPDARPARRAHGRRYRCAHPA